MHTIAYNPKHVRFVVPESKQTELLEYFTAIAKGTDMTCYAEVARPTWGVMNWYGQNIFLKNRAVVLVFEHVKNSAAFVNGAIDACPWARFLKQ